MSEKAVTVTDHSSLIPSSRNRSSPVQPNDLPRDVAAGRAEEMDGLGDVGWRAGAREGDALEVLLAFRFGVIVGPLDDAGGDAVDGDVRGELSGEAQRQVPQRGL